MHLHMQVTGGGNYDVDASITSPRNATVYHVRRKATGRFEWNVDVAGVYKVCFGNQFSTITHKFLAFDIRVVDDLPPTSTPTATAAVNASDESISYVRATTLGPS